MLHSVSGCPLLHTGKKVQQRLLQPERGHPAKQVALLKLWRPLSSQGKGSHTVSSALHQYTDRTFASKADLAVFGVQAMCLPFHSG